MEMWYLVLVFGGYNDRGMAAVVIPDKYPTEQACRVAAKGEANFKCIPAPKSDLPKTCESFGQGTNMVICRN